MLEATAVVTRCEQGKVWIRSQQSSACQACAQQTSCATATLAKMLPTREFALVEPLAVEVGAEVRVSIADAHLLLSAMVLYLLPLVSMLIGVGLANIWLPDAWLDTGLPLIALGILLLVFGLIHTFQGPLLLRIAQLRVAVKC